MTKPPREPVNAPLTISRGVIWNMDDPAERAELVSGSRETQRANLALSKFLNLGATRSISALLMQYPLRPALLHVPGLERVRLWQVRYAWDERVSQFDELNRQREARREAERQHALLNEGLAVSALRVEQLIKIYNQLKAEMLREDRFWLVEVKHQRVADDKYERVENLHFNAALFAQARGALADLAREIGAQAQRGAGSTPNAAAAADGRLDFAGLSTDERCRLEELLRKAGLADELFP